MEARQAEMEWIPEEIACEKERLLTPDSDRHSIQEDKEVPKVDEEDGQVLAASETHRCVHACIFLLETVLVSCFLQPRNPLFKGFIIGCRKQLQLLREVGKLHVT